MRVLHFSRFGRGGDVWNVLTIREERIHRAEELFGWVRDGSLWVEIARRFHLSEGAAAHGFLESRASIGKVLLLPDDEAAG